MKDFVSISEAIEYHKECYICKSILRVDFHGEPLKIKTDLEDYRQNSKLTQTIELNLTDMVDSDVDDLLTINIWTNKVTIRTTQRVHYLDPVYGNSNYAGQTPTKLFVKGLQKVPSRHGYNGKLFESLTIGCQNCHQFSYVVQVVIDGTAMRVEHLFLNSEFISWSEKEITHEIKNIYPTGKTEYSRSASIGKSHLIDCNISIPLIPLNLTNPVETMDRIKKLNLFS
jgi:hypothetical protein